MQEGTEVKPVERYGAEWREEKRVQKEREQRGEGSREMADVELGAEVRRLLKHMAEIDWDAESPGNVSNMLMNLLGQSPAVGYGHPVVARGLFRVREALAQISNAARGVFV